jgi:hypothetical protein
MPNLLMKYYLHQNHTRNKRYNKWFCLYFESWWWNFSIGIRAPQQHCTLANASRENWRCSRVIQWMGELIMSTYDQLLSDKTKIVTVNHISNALGTINPVKYDW